MVSPSSAQDSSIFSIGSSGDDVVLERPPIFDEKDRQNSIAELVENRERAIKDTEATEREKQQNIDRSLIKVAARYKKQVSELQSQLDAERLKNEQLTEEKQEADAALMRAERQMTAIVKSKVESHNADLARKDAELQALKGKYEEAKMIAVREMIEKKDAEILELQSQAEAIKELKAVEYSCLQKQIDAAMKQGAQSAEQLEALKKQWHDQEVQSEEDLQRIKDANEAALKEKDAQMAEAKEQWGAEFEDLIKQLESMSAEVEKYKQVSVEQKPAIELSKGDGGPASNYHDSSTDVSIAVAYVL